jgi:hypothetical protein
VKSLVLTLPRVLQAVSLFILIPAALALMIFVAPLAHANTADIQMLPPSAMNSTATDIHPCTGLVAGSPSMLAWDGQNPINCVTGISASTDLTGFTTVAINPGRLTFGDSGPWGGATENRQWMGPCNDPACSPGGMAGTNLFEISGWTNPAFGLNRTGTTQRVIGLFDSVVIPEPNAKVGIATSSPQYTLDVNGEVQAIAYYYASDARLKTGIHPIPDALDKLLAVKGVDFRWKDSGRADMGVVAQNVAEVFPELVTKNKDGIMAVEYGNMIAPIIESIRQLKADDDKLKIDADNLRGEVEALKIENSRLRAALPLEEQKNETAP